MFGFVGELRSKTQGKGEYTMEYARYAPTPASTQDRFIREYQESLGNLQKKSKN